MSGDAAWTSTARPTEADPARPASVPTDQETPRFRAVQARITLASWGKAKAAQEEIDALLMPWPPWRAEPSTQKPRICGASKRVSDGTRTRDRLDHNQELYQLSYAHQGSGSG